MKRNLSGPLATSCMTGKSELLQVNPYRLFVALYPRRRGIAVQRQPSC
ncbi:hypothetical protein HU079_24170 [Salmonella enterica subsp. enterica serovar Typhimurium]|nr:hypothetical protein [Salmonella enterica subsp. enterica serovar Typhimurium]MBZ5166509.1 hypothetical protein [Salmonella enterica subsp. enterica serovar Typhimurium]